MKYLLLIMIFAAPSLLFAQSAQDRELFNKFNKCVIEYVYKGYFDYINLEIFCEKIDLKAQYMITKMSFTQNSYYFESSLKTQKGVILNGAFAGGVGTEDPSKVATTLTGPFGPSNIMQGPFGPSHYHQAPTAITTQQVPSSRPQQTTPAFGDIPNTPWATSGYQNPPGPFASQQEIQNWQTQQTTQRQQQIQQQQNAPRAFAPGCDGFGPAPPGC